MKKRLMNRKLKVAAGHYHLFHRVAPTVARAKGYFRDEGLEVEVSATGTDVKSLQALMDEELDLIVDLKTPVALQARDQGKAILLIAGFLNTYPGILVGAREIRSLADLKGKKIGLREPNGVALTMSCMILKKAGLEPDGDVIFVPHTGASSFKSISPRLDRGEIQARIAHKAYAADFQRAGYPILADVGQYLPNGYQLRAVAAREAFLEKNRGAVVGFLNGLIRAYRFMKDPGNHPEMMAIIKDSELEFEQDMDQNMWQEEYPLIPAIPVDGGINAAGLEVILGEEKLAGRVSRAMSVNKILCDRYVREAANQIGAA